METKESKSGNENGGKGGKKLLPIEEGSFEKVRIYRKGRFGGGRTEEAVLKRQGSLREEERSKSLSE